MSDHLTSNQFAEAFKEDCNHFLNGRCTTLACMHRDAAGNRAFVGCAAYQAVKRIAELEGMSKALIKGVASLDDEPPVPPKDEWVDRIEGEAKIYFNTLDDQEKDAWYATDRTYAKRMIGDFIQYLRHTVTKPEHEPNCDFHLWQQPQDCICETIRAKRAARDKETTQEYGCTAADHYFAAGSHRCQCGGALRANSSCERWHARTPVETPARRSNCRCGKCGDADLGPDPDPIF